MHFFWVSSGRLNVHFGRQLGCVSVVRDAGLAGGNESAALPKLVVQPTAAAALPSFAATLWMRAAGSIPGIGEAKFTSSATPSERLTIGHVSLDDKYPSGDTSAPWQGCLDKLGLLHDVAA